MQPPMIGTWDVELHQVRPFTIHGDLYYEVHAMRLAEPVQMLVAIRIPQHAAATPPTSGERWRLSFLMGQVTSAEKIT